MSKDTQTFTPSEPSEVFNQLPDLSDIIGHGESEPAKPDISIVPDEPADSSEYELEPGEIPKGFGGSESEVPDGQLPVFDIAKLQEEVDAVAAPLSDQQLVDSKTKDLTAPEKKKRRKILTDQLSEAKQRAATFEKQNTQYKSDLDARSAELDQTRADMEKSMISGTMPAYDARQDKDVISKFSEQKRVIDDGEMELGQGFGQKAMDWASQLYSIRQDPQKVTEFRDGIAEIFDHNASHVMSKLGTIIRLNEEGNSLASERQKTHGQDIAKQFSERRDKFKSSMSDVGNATQAHMTQNPMDVNSIITRAVGQIPGFGDYVEELRQKSAVIGLGLAPPTDPSWDHMRGTDGEFTSEGRRQYSAALQSQKEMLEQLPRQMVIAQAATSLMRTALERTRDLEARIGKQKGGEPQITPDVGDESSGSDMPTSVDLSGAPVVNPYLKGL
jgi:hypothetical protein